MDPADRAHWRTTGRLTALPPRFFPLAISFITATVLIVGAMDGGY